MTENHNKEIDAVSGVETTGHEWDGLKELNNPAPRWWLWVFFVCCIWAAGYWVLYPAWPVPASDANPAGATKGTLGWTQFTKLKAEQGEIDARQDVYAAKFKDASFDQIMKDEELYKFAVAGGRAAFKNNCAVCHGSGAQGGVGFPNLNDDDWLWGGKLSDIYQTLQYGIRSGHEQARTSQMPSFGKDGILDAASVDSVVDYVLALSEGKADGKMPGAQIFADNCVACHGDKGQGGREFGAPKLADAIWLYGGDRESVHNTVFNAHAGVMPYWKGKLSDDTLRQLTVYVYSLGGGEPENGEKPAQAAAPAATEQPATPAATEGDKKDAATKPAGDAAAAESK